MINQRFASLALVLAAFSGCTTVMTNMAASYNSALVQIDRPEATKERYGAVVTIRPESGNKYVYEDGLFRGIFYATSSRINFEITNKTDHSLKIIWNEAAFIDVNGQSDRVAHSGVKYADVSGPQPPSVVPRQTSLSDFALPSDRIYYRSGPSYEGGGWKELGLVLPTSDKVVAADSVGVRTFRAKVESNKGRRFGLLLPIEIEGVVNEYTFWFKVQDASIEKWETKEVYFE